MKDTSVGCKTAFINTAAHGVYNLQFTIIAKGGASEVVPLSPIVITVCDPAIATVSKDAGYSLDFSILLSTVGAGGSKKKAINSSKFVSGDSTNCPIKQFIFSETTPIADKGLSLVSGCPTIPDTSLQCRKMTFNTDAARLIGGTPPNFDF